MKTKTLFGSAVTAVVAVLALVMPAATTVAMHGGPIYTVVGPVPHSAVT